MRSDKTSVDALQHAARALLEERDIPLDVSVPWRELAPILAVQFNCVTMTARRHLVKAQRIRRGEEVRRRGGPRQGSGPPEGNVNAKRKEEPTMLNDPAKKLIARAARVEAREMRSRLALGANRDVLCAEAWRAQAHQEWYRLNGAADYFETVFENELTAD